MAKKYVVKLKESVRIQNKKYLEELMFLQRCTDSKFILECAANDRDSTYIRNVVSSEVDSWPEIEHVVSEKNLKWWLDNGYVTVEELNNV